MSYTATIKDPNNPGAKPMWESSDHATADSAYRAATAHLDTRGPGGSIADYGHGQYAIWGTDSTGRPKPIATLVIAATDRLEAVPAGTADQLSDP